MSADPKVIEVPQSFTRNEDRGAVVPLQANATPMQMLAVAMNRGMDAATLKDLMDLSDRWEKNEARKSYAMALAAFKANPPEVYKDKENAQYNSKYASIGNLINSSVAALSAQGLSHHWDIDQSAGIRVTCVLTHRAGHSEAVSMSGPPDDSGKKNPLQQIKSTVTYLKIATFEAVTGITTKDGNADDDGNGAAFKGMPDDEFGEWVKKIKATTTKAAAKEVCADAIKVADTYNDLIAYKALKSALKEQDEHIEAAAAREKAGK